MTAESSISDLLGMGGGGLFGALTLAIAFFLKQKFEQKKAGRETSTFDKPAGEWLKSFLEAMTQDRKDMKEIFRTLASEIRESHKKSDALAHSLGGMRDSVQQSHQNLTAGINRVEQKTDHLLQRRTS